MITWMLGLAIFEIEPLEFKLGGRGLYVGFQLGEMAMALPRLVEFLPIFFITTS